MYYNDEHLGFFGTSYLDTIPGENFMLFVGQSSDADESTTHLIYLDEKAQRELVAELLENLKVNHGGLERLHGRRPQPVQCLGRLPQGVLTAMGAFTSGWEAARENYSTLSMSAHSVHWRAGYDAYLGALDIGGVLR